MEIIYVFVAIHGGLIDDVQAFSHEDGAIKAWENYTKKVYGDFVKDFELLYGLDCEGSDIHETVIHTI